MSHLTQEQFEDILQGGQKVPDHIDQCPDCRARLEEKRALAQRVRGTFSAIQAGADLTNRIRADVAAAGQAASAATARPRIIPLRFHRHIWSALAATAAVLIVAVSIAFYVSTGSKIKAAQTALVEIHQANLSSLAQPATGHDPNELGTFFQNKVGYSPVMPCAGAGMNACGCSVQEFCGRPVASYVVKGPNAPVSVIVVPHSPRALGMTPAKDEATAKRAIWQAACGNCNMASIRIGEYSYCAVGQVAQEELTGVLNALSE